MTKLFDKIIARMLKDAAFLAAMKAAQPGGASALEAAVDAEFKPGTWALGLTDAQKDYFTNVLNYADLETHQAGLDAALGPYSSDYFFTDY